MYCNTKYSWQQKLPITLTLNLVAIPRSYFNYYKFDDNQYPLVAKITYFATRVMMVVKASIFCNQMTY